MAEVAPAAAPEAQPKPQAKPAKKKASKGSTKSTPGARELVLKTLNASKDRKGTSYVALRKALAAEGYDVERNAVQVKRAIIGLVEKNAIQRVKGIGVAGSFRACKAEKPKREKKTGLKVRKPKPSPRKQGAVKRSAVKTTPKKKKASDKKVAPKKSPKKVKSTKSPAVKRSVTPKKKEKKEKAAKKPAAKKTPKPKKVSAKKPKTPKKPAAKKAAKK